MESTVINSVISPKSKINACERPFHFFAFAFYLALSFVKMHAYLRDGRFWAEEGVVFYSEISNTHFLKSLAYIFNGHLELVTNFVVAISTLIDFQYAPLLTTYASLFFQSIPIILLIFHYKNLGLTKWGLIGFLLVVVGLPQSSEVWANSINLHFHFALLAAVIAAIRIDETHPKFLFRLMLALSGLSGIPANFVTPVFLALAITKKEKERWIQFGIIAATSVFQISLLILNNFNVGSREFSLHPGVYWLAILSQQILSPLFGFETGEKLAAVLREVLAKNKGSIIFAIICTVPFFYFTMHTFRSRSQQVWALALSALLLSLLCILTSIGEKTALISSSAGLRYFYASNAIIALYVLVTFSSCKNGLFRFFVAILLVSSAFRINHYIAGPTWQREYENAKNNRSESINIWPLGWKMKNFQTN